MSASKRCCVPYYQKRVGSVSVTPRPTYWDTVFHKLTLVDECPPIQLVIGEPSHNQVISLHNINRHVQIKGYFQNDSYLDRDLILEMFQLPEHSSSYVNKRMGELREKYPEKKLIFVHVRRGDYLHLQHFHIVLSREWYTRALKHFDTEECVFLIFSDDLQWCRENFAEYHEKEFMDVEEDYVQLFMMSQCDGGIVANSTFSWWGAYLIRNPSAPIVCPTHWYLDHTDQRVMRNRSEWIHEPTFF